MNKQELITAVAEASGSTKKDTETFINAFTEVVTETLSQGSEINIVGFGKFLTRERAARVGRNPQTNQEIQIDASILPSFRAGKSLKDAVNSR